VVAAKRTKTSARLPRDERGGVDLRALDLALADLARGAPSRRRRRLSAAPRPNLATSTPSLVVSPTLSEPGPLSVTSVSGLVSLPPPPSSLPPLAIPRASKGPVIAGEGFREPSLPPPPGETLDPLTTLLPPKLSLAPPATDLSDEVPPILVPGGVQLSLVPEALELDLSVLGPSEPSPEADAPTEAVQVVEIDGVELDEVRLAGEPLPSRKVAPPLPPPVIRRAR